MNKIDFERKMLIKLMKKDLNSMLNSEDFRKEDAIKVLDYFLKKVNLLS